jgi:hypothetical protein
MATVDRTVMVVPPTLPRQAEAEEVWRVAPEDWQVVPEVRLVVEVVRLQQLQDREERRNMPSVWESTTTTQTLA